MPEPGHEGTGTTRQYCVTIEFDCDGVFREKRSATRVTKLANRECNNESEAKMGKTWAMQAAGGRFGRSSSLAWVE